MHESMNIKFIFALAEQMLLPFKCLLCITAWSSLFAEKLIFAQLV